MTTRKGLRVDAGNRPIGSAKGWGAKIPPGKEASKSGVQQDGRITHLSRREGAVRPRTRKPSERLPRGMTKSPRKEAVTSYSEQSRLLAGGGGRSASGASGPASGVGAQCRGAFGDQRVVIKPLSAAQEGRTP